MKVQVYENSEVDVRKPGNYLFLKEAIGEIEVTWTEDGERRTDRLSTGGTLYSRFEDVSLRAVSQSQIIDIYYGSASGYQPPMSSVVAGNIDRIYQPVQIAGTIPVTGSVTISGTADVTGSVTVSGTADVTGSVVDLGHDVEVVGNRSDTISTGEITIPAGDYRVIPANSQRCRLLLQNDSEIDELIKCRVTEADAVAPTGPRLIGGDGVMGELKLCTKAGVKVWNTSTTQNATISYAEELINA